MSRINRIQRLGRLWALVTSFLAFAASCLFSLVDKDEKRKQILYLSIIQENYSAEYILTLQENETAIEKLNF